MKGDIPMASPRNSSKSKSSSSSGNVTGQGEFRSTPVKKTGLISGMTFGIKPVQYSVVDGMAVFEGDIILGTAEQLDAQTEQLRQVASGAVALGVGITGAQFRWPNCLVPY